MGNEVATRASGGALAAANALKGNLQKVKQTLPEARGTGFMSFGKDGIWTFGQSNEEVFPEDVIAINPFSIETGFICWSDRGESGPKNEVLGEEMFALGQDVPMKSTLPQKHDEQSVKSPEWKEQIKVQMRFMSGPNKDQQVSYAATSIGGIDALRGLIDQIMLQLDEDPENIVPLCTLDASSYVHKKWGKTYVPVIRITDWTSIDGAKPETEGEDEGGEEEQAEEKPKRSRQRPASEEKPKRTRKRPAEAEEEAEEQPEVEEEQAEEPAPRRRRRR